MSRVYIGMSGTDQTTFEINGSASDWASSEANAVADITPIEVAVGTDATTDSTATVPDGNHTMKAVLIIGTQYSAGTTATLSLYNASGSQDLGSNAADIDLVKAAGTEIEVPLDITNDSGYDGVFRITISGSPAAGAMTAILYPTPAPAA